MEILNWIIFGFVILAYFFFYVHQKYIWVGLAIMANLSTLGILMSGGWPLLIIIGIPTIILNYFAIENISENNEK